MSKFLRLLGYAWAAPLTLIALVYVGLFTVLGWYRWVGPKEDALVWQVDRAPTWLQKLWAKWAGHCLGNVVVLKHVPGSDPGRVTLRHEMQHARQCMRLGIFQPILYGLCWVAIKVACTKSDPYFDNVMEIDARRAAGQVIDVVGLTKKLQQRRQATNK